MQGVMPMKDWMTIRDLHGYLQISENKIRFFIKQKQIPFHNKHGILRFSREEIDEWMKTPDAKPTEQSEDKKDFYIYRDRPIKEYALTATKVLIGKRPWERLYGFIRNFMERIGDIKVHDNGRDFLRRKEFSLFSNKYSDYLNVCCQLGLIDKRSGAGREKRYYPTIYSQQMAGKDGAAQSKRIILDSVLAAVQKNLETSPDERHAILLLWYILSIRAKGLQPNEGHFRKSAGEFSYYPSIRLNFSKSLCDFLFDNDRNKERHFLNEWNRLIVDPKKAAAAKHAGEKLALFD
jgi:predicted DNA-binding transcriptional regulator AlpA